MNWWTRVLLPALVAAALLLPFVVPAIAGRDAWLGKFLADGDFNAFYCGGLVAREGHDPYKLAPLKACQTQIVEAPGGVAYADVGIDPAPLPVYDLAFFAPFSFLDYRIAGTLWTCIIVAAIFGSAEALRRLTGIPFWATLAVLATGDGITCITYGQEQPLVTLALVCAALLLRAERPNAAAIVASITLIEPHVGAPVLLALFCWTRAKLALALCCVAAGAVALLFGGLPLNAEYFTRVLPVHAFAEIALPIQFSLTAFLNAFGVPDQLALKLATLQYALSAVFAVALAGRIAQRIGSPAIVLFPAACAVFGGTYIHIQQISSALPFALFLAGCVPALAAWGWAAAALIALPWPAFGFQREYLVLDFAIVAAATTALAGARFSKGRLAITVGAVFVAYLLCGRPMTKLPTAHIHPPESPAVVAAGGYDPSLASTQMAVEIRSNAVTNGATVENFVPRLPVWAGLLFVVAGGVRTLRKR